MDGTKHKVFDILFISELQSMCMKLVSACLIALVVVFIGLLGLLPASAANGSTGVFGLINGQNVDAATSRSAAINITDPSVQYSWVVKNETAQTLLLKKVVVSYSFFLPNKEFDFTKTVAPGASTTSTGSVTLPGWVLKLKGFYEVSAYLYDTSGSVVANRTFWVYLGAGSWVTGPVGATGVGLGVTAVATGVGAVVQAVRAPSSGSSTKKKRGRCLRNASSIAMMLAVLFIMMALGIGITRGGSFAFIEFLSIGLFAGIGDNVLIRLVTKLPRLRAIGK